MPLPECVRKGRIGRLLPPLREPGDPAVLRASGLAYQSFRTLTANPHLLADETVGLLCTKYRRTPAQVLFRYLTQGGVTLLTGTTSEAHMREDLAIFEFELTASELAAVSALL
jgi:diketogulonate reductase-like aldo/keto reductase